MKKNMAIDISGLQKSYGEKQVLQDVSFTVKPGEIFGLIGLNGAGKTTMIKILLGLLKPDGGDAFLFGKPVSETDTRNQLAFLPEKFQPSAYLKGFEHIDITLSFYKQKLDKKKAEALAEKLELNPAVLNHKMSKYSKGMGQKLGLMSTLLAERPLLILDEPMSGLDPQARISLKKTVQDYVKQGHTIFFSSHILSDLDEVCDRVAILDKSEIQFLGKPADLKKQTKEKSLEKAFLKLIQ